MYEEEGESLPITGSLEILSASLQNRPLWWWLSNLEKHFLLVTEVCKEKPSERLPAGLSKPQSVRLARVCIAAPQRTGRKQRYKPHTYPPDQCFLPFYHSQCI